MIMANWTIKNIYMSPTFISAAMTAIGSIIYVSYLSYLQKDISARAVALVTLALFGIYVGELFGRSVKLKSDNIIKEKPSYLYIKKSTTLIVIVFMIILLVLRLRHIQSSIGIYSVISAVSNYRAGLLRGENYFPVYINIATWFAEIFCYLYVYVYISNLISNRVNEFRNLVPVVIYALVSLTSTGRTNLIVIVVYLITFTFLTIYERGDALTLSSKTLRRIIIGLAIFAGIFFLLGKVRAESIDGGTFVFVDSLFDYVSAGLYGLEVQLEKHILEESQYFGYYTLQFIYDFFNIPRSSVPSAYGYGYQTANGSYSNLYMSIVFPMQDYGVFGMFITRIIIAAIFIIIYKKILDYRRGGIGYRVFLFLFLLPDLYYSFVEFLIYDRIRGTLLYPEGLIRHTILAWIVAKYLLRIRLRDEVTETYKIRIRLRR